VLSPADPGAAGSWFSLAVVALTLRRSRRALRRPRA